jgi:hypothetical protein
MSLKKIDDEWRWKTLGYYRDAQGQLVPIRAAFWQFLAQTDIDTLREKADRVARYLEWMDRADEATKVGDLVTLKDIADQVRCHLGELPSSIPKDGFADVDKLEYTETLTAPEIKDRLLSDIKRRGLTEWYEVGIGIRKAAIQ